MIVTTKLVIALASAMLVLGAISRDHQNVKAAAISLNMRVDPDGHYRMTFDDPGNQWRCTPSGMAYQASAFHITCSRKAQP